MIVFRQLVWLLSMRMDLLPFLATPPSARQ